MVGATQVLGESAARKERARPGAQEESSGGSSGGSYASARLHVQLHEADGRRRAARGGREQRIERLERTIDEGAEQHQRDQHQLQVDLWRQREALNKQMKERIKQAKTNFLGSISGLDLT